jgi:hypothetical protein
VQAAATLQLDTSDISSDGLSPTSAVSTTNRSPPSGADWTRTNVGIDMLPMTGIISTGGQIELSFHDNVVKTEVLASSPSLNSTDYLQKRKYQNRCAQRAYRSRQIQKVDKLNAKVQKLEAENKALRLVTWDCGLRDHVAHPWPGC